MFHSFPSTNSSKNEFVGSEIDSGSSDGKKKSKNVNRIRKMYVFAFSSLLIAMATGLSSGYSAPATYDMTTRSNSVIKPNTKEVMWIGSILALGVIVGSLISGPLADKVGRKDTLIYNIIPAGFGWLIVCYAWNVPILILGRFVSGVSCGIVSVVIPMYCVEISTTEVRGKLGSAFQGFIAIGHLLTVTIGAFISWKYLALHGAIVSILVTIGFCLAPETPRWFLMKNDLKNAISAMDEIQGGFLDSKKECEDIYKDLQKQPRGYITLKEFKHPTVMKPALISLALVFFQAFSGVNVIFTYTSSIFEISKNFIDPKLGTIIISVVQMIGTLTSNLIIDKSGRKLLLMVSGSVMAISCAIFGVYYYMISIDITFEQIYSWVPLVCLIVFVSGFSFGYGPVPYLLSAEMLPLRARSTVSAMIQVTKGLVVFLVTNLFSDMENRMHKYGTFWFYSTVSVLGVIFIILFVPETKGKKLEAVQDLFVRTSVKRDVNIGDLT